MRTLEPESVHCVVTSPPYWGLRDYGNAGQLGLEATPEEYVANLVDVFREVRRVLRSDGTVWLNLGDSYYRDPRRGDQENGGHAGLSAGRTAAGAMQRRASGIMPEKNLVGIPWRVAFALQADGWYLRSDIIWSKPNPMPESVTDRPTKSHEYLFLLSKKATYYFDADAVREPDVTRPQRWISDGMDKREVPGQTKQSNGMAQRKEAMLGTGRNIRSVWTIATQPYPGAHFATFPRKLVEPCVKAGCPADGVVLDPFAGSGTTGAVAQALGRRAILIDINPDYLAQAMGRNRDIPLGLVG